MGIWDKEQNCKKSSRGDRKRQNKFWQRNEDRMERVGDRATERTKNYQIGE